jgi:hypothetical protein
VLFRSYACLGQTNCPETAKAVAKEDSPPHVNSIGSDRDATRTAKCPSVTGHCSADGRTAETDLTCRLEAFAHVDGLVHVDKVFAETDAIGAAS